MHIYTKLNTDLHLDLFSSSTFHISLFLKLYTEKLQVNEQIKLYTIYTNTVNPQMELAPRTNYHIYISNKFTVFAGLVSFISH